MTLVVDTGPLIAMLHVNDRYHAWATRVLAVPGAPFATCDAVVTEACFLAERVRAGGASAVVSLCKQRLLAPTFRFADEVAPVAAIMRKYADVPMSFADACLVRMIELDAAAVVVTLDTDFRVYRRNGRNAIPVIAPWSM